MPKYLLRIPKLVGRDLLLLFILALLVRLLAALPQQQPNYMDAAYYYVNAVNLAQGRGFVEDFVWIYLDNPAPPPHPSHLYWLPLTSILAALGMLGGGVTYRAAQVPFIIISAMLPPITYAAVYIVSNRRPAGWLAGLLAIFSGFYFPFWTAIDNFTPFAVAGSLSLLLAGWAWQVANSKWQITNGKWQIVDKHSLFTIYNSQLILLLAGICAGLAHLSRADGPLLLVAIAIVYGCWTLANTQPVNTPTRQRFMPYAIRLVLLLLGYLLIMTPWFIRNWRVSGDFLPVAGSQTIWLTRYDDLFSYGRELSAQTFLAQGTAAIIQGRWWALITNLQTVLAVWGMIFVLPLALVGLWQLRRHRLMQLAAVYALLLFMVLTLIFAFPGARGGLFHSGGALLPFIYAAAVVGLDSAIAWAAAHRRRWNARLAKKVFGVGLAMMAVALSSFIYYRQVIQNNAWNNADGLYPAIAAWVSQQNPTATVMINNPPAYRYHGGGLSVVIPNEDVETMLQAARRYHVDYLILEANHPAALTKLYRPTLTDSRLRWVKTFGDTYIFQVTGSR